MASNSPFWYDPSTSNSYREVTEPNSVVYLAENLFQVSDLTSYAAKKDGRAAEVPVIVDDVSLALHLGIENKTLWWARINKNGKRDRVSGSLVLKPDGTPVQPGLYTTLRIPKGKDKKTGKTKYRYLNVPDDRLKFIQKQLVAKVFNKFDYPEYITGFVKGRSIRDTADVHAGKNIVVSLDIENFFPSIKESHVREAIENVLGYPKEVARLISELCTMSNFVPQGAPTSPAVSNLVGYYFFDKKVKELLDAEGFSYTRYADDLTFSTDKEFPKLTEPDPEDPEDTTKHPTSDLDPIINKVTKLLRSSGFKVNKRKTKIMRKGGRQWVLGQVVNIYPNILRKEYNKLRAILHNVGLNGIEEEAKKTNRTPMEFLQWLKGHILYVRQINEHRGEALYDNFKLLTQHFNVNDKDIQEISIILSENDYEIENNT